LRRLHRRLSPKIIMPKFSYQAITETGSTLSGVLEADSTELAAGILVEKGYIPAKIKEKAEIARGINLPRFMNQFGSVTLPDLILFTKQFRTMIHAGVPMLSILTVMEQQTENRKLKRILASMAEGIKEGSTLYDAFRKHTQVFSPLYCSMIKAGESSGVLAEVMARLIYMLEHEHKIKSDIKSALQYPIMVTVFLVVAFFVLLTFVIPRFVNVFVNAGIALPLPTRICMTAYEYLIDYWFIVLGAAIMGTTALFYYGKTEQGKYIRDSLILKIPAAGSLSLKAAMSRFASIFAILHSSGLTVLDSLRILSGTMGNMAIAKEFDRIEAQIKEGHGIAEPLKSAKYFPPMVVNMVAIGEESGNLEEMLSEVAGHYDDEVEYAMKRLSEALGPMLTIGLAAIVGFFALAVFLPMWDLTKLIH